MVSLKWCANEFSQHVPQDSPVQARKIEILKQNSHSFLTFTFISLLLSLFLPASLGLSPFWNYGNCLLQNWSLQPDSLSSLTIHRLSLDFNLSQNQSHSQATQPFCIPASLCVWVRIKMPAECQWETWLLFQLCLVHFRGWQIIYLHNICKVILHCFGAFLSKCILN